MTQINNCDQPFSRCHLLLWDFITLFYFAKRFLIQNNVAHHYTLAEVEQTTDVSCNKEQFLILQFPVKFMGDE